MKATPRKLNVEALELRALPSTLIQSFATGGWTQWSNDGSTVFTTPAAQGGSGATEIVSTGGSNTSGLAWETQSEPGESGVSADIELTSLVPSYVFLGGSNLGTSTPSYLAAVVTRGATVSLVQVENGTATTLGTVSSPSSAYFSGNWAEVALVPSGNSIDVQVIRQDTGQYLNSQGTWQSAAANAIVSTSTLAASAGNLGIGRFAAYAGAVDFENFAVTLSPPSPPSQPVSVSPLAPAVSQSFDTTTPGTLPAGWQSWKSDSTGTAQVSSSLSLSLPNGLALGGISTTTVRAWSTAALPAAVSASAAIDLDSLIPAEIIVDGVNLNTPTPTYDALTITRGLEASLVQVVNGASTTLATLGSTSYVSGQWVQVELTAQGADLAATIYRTDTDQWLKANGSWSSTPAYAFAISNAASLAAGESGLGRAASYAGTLTFDNFSAGAVGTVGPAVTVTSSASSGTVSGLVAFQAAGAGNVSQLSFLLNGQLVSSSRASTANWVLNTTTLASGSYTLTVLAGGTDGTVGAATYNFTVANTVPPPPTSTQITVDANPSAGSSYSPVPASDTLFGPNGPSYLDVDQGEDGDCWLIASLAEVAEQAPQDIENMFKYDGTVQEGGTAVGVYTVRFYNSSGVPEYVTVDTELPAGGGLYDHPLNGVLWVALAEKAYAVANGLGFVTTSEPGSNSYNALNLGYASSALEAITGQTAASSFISPGQIAADWQAGEFVVLSTVSPASSFIIGDHDYAVVGYNSANGLFELMNPWGGTTTSNLCPQDNQVYGLFSASASFLSANFSDQWVEAGKVK